MSHVTRAAVAGVLAAALACVSAGPGTPARAGTSPAAGPSFRCDGESLTTVERRICADPSLAALDLELAHVSAETIALSKHALAISGESLKWFTDVRDACPTSRCLSGAYRARIAALRAEAGRSSRAAADALVRRPAVHVGSAVRAALLAMAKTGCVANFFGVDLGDGRRSLVTMDCQHGANDSTVYVFHPEGTSYRLVLRSVMQTADLQDERAFGLRRIRVRTHGSVAFTAVTFYDYDGSAYRAVACGQEFVPRGEDRLRFELDACGTVP